MDRTGYNTYTDFPNYSYKCIEHLVANNELIWKLLKYNTPDAWNLTNLTHAEKAALIWAGEGFSSDFRVFMDEGQPDSQLGEVCILRISPYGIFPDNRTVDTITVLMEVYSHYKINTLSNYTTRVDSIIQQLLEVFNGIPIEALGSIGRLHMNKLGTSPSRMESSGQIPFRGKWILLGNKSAA